MARRNTSKATTRSTTSCRATPFNLQRSFNMANEENEKAEAAKQRAEANEKRVEDRADDAKARAEAKAQREAERAADERERAQTKEARTTERAHRVSDKQAEDLKNAQEQLDAAATVFNTGGQAYAEVDPNTAPEAFGVSASEFNQGVVINADETAPGEPSRVPEEMAVGEVVYQPIVREHDPLGTTDGEEPRVVADDLLREIQRPIKPSALGESRDDAVVGVEDEDMDADHDSRIIVNDPRNDLPEEGGVKVVQVAEENVSDESPVAEAAQPEDV